MQHYAAVLKTFQFASSRQTINVSISFLPVWPCGYLRGREATIQDSLKSFLRDLWMMKDTQIRCRPTHSPSDRVASTVAGNRKYHKCKTDLALAANFVLVR